jgi:signal recognition particle subunit SRP54
MFESLTEKIQETFRNLSRRGHLTEADVQATLREVRLALLEADVNYRVVKDFTKAIEQRAVGVDVARSLTPAQAVIKIVNEELIRLLGEPAKLDLGGEPPAVIMLAGLQGSGKTTMASKLALHLKEKGQRPLLVAADTYRPAAITQLETLGKQIGVDVHSEGDKLAPPKICANALKRANKEGYTVVLMDTAGRLQIDDDMMAELEKVREVTRPREVLLVVDAMTGQEAVAVADAFNKRIHLTGLVLTKIDGDARGGAALSIRSVTGVPIKFMGVGERPSDLEVFYPDRLASRILGMGDMLTLIEKAESAFSEEEAQKIEKKMRTATFTLEDFADQLKAMRKMGSVSELLGMVPGMGQVTKQVSQEDMDKSLGVVQAIVNSMTREERRNPKIIDGSRKRRIAKGSGTQVFQVNQMLRQFQQMQTMMKQISSNKGRGLMSMFR